MSSAGLMIVVASGATSLATLAVAVTARLAADDIKAWSPKISSWLLGRAVNRLPEAMRARYSEEWAAHIADIPGTLGPLIVALHLQWASVRALLEARERDALHRWQAWAAKLAVGVADVLAALEDIKANLELGRETSADVINLAVERLGLVSKEMPRPDLTIVGLATASMKVAAVWRKAVSAVQKVF